VSRDDFADAAVVLIGHGSSVNAESGEAVRRQADELRRRKLFAEMREAFWKREPQLTKVVSSLTTARIFLVPLFISEGYFSEGVIPRALGFCEEGEGAFSRVQQRGSQRLFYCKPVGTHERMAEVLLARAREVVERFPFPRAPAPSETTLFLAGHGTEQNENSRKAIEQQAERIRSLNVYAAVHALFLEEKPRIGECYQLAQTRNMVIVPFLIGEGQHAEQDLPVLLGEPERVVKQRLNAGQPPWRNPTERKGKMVWYAESVGSDPKVAEVVLDRVREAAQW
jgi:sirohydrochlorin cobaltochelatase